MPSKSKIVSDIVVIALVVLTAGCSATATPTTPSPLPSPQASLLAAAATGTASPAHTWTTTPTSVPLSPTATETPTKVATPPVTATVGPTVTSTAPPEARLSSQCLAVLPALPSGTASSGVVVLEGRTIGGDHPKGNTYLFDLAAGTTITVENGGYLGKVSPDRTYWAYDGIVFDASGKITKDNLIIADANGQLLKVIPWETGWLEILGWTDNQQVVIHRSEPGVNSLKYDTYLVLNPFTGQRQILRRNFPTFVDTSLWYHFFPYWEGWYGVLYDPTLTRAIYPRPAANDSHYATYGLWDVSKQRLVASFDSIFKVPTSDTSLYFMPTWSPDGSQFVFMGAVPDPLKVVVFELFRVSRDGIVQQLTHLDTIDSVERSNLSWSPDGRYIAMFLERYASDQQQARVAVLDITTLEVTDYCVPVTFAGTDYGLQPPRAVWSPASTQFLVVDWYSQDHRRVILVDIAKGFAAQVAQDTEPVGWMVH